MPTIKTRDNTDLYYKDWGAGQPVMFSHGWPLTADAFEDQMFFLASHGYRCIAHDRRGHGRSGQPWNGNDMDTYADDLAELAAELGIRDAVFVGHSTGGGEVVRYIARHGTARVARVVLIGAVVPALLGTAAKPGGAPFETFDRLRAAVRTDRSQFYRDFSRAFYGYNRAGAELSPGVCDAFWLQAMLGGLGASYECIKAFSETDFSDDLKTVTVPALILHGDDDQIVPIDDSARLALQLLPNATLKIYEGAPHGLCTTLKDRVNADLLAFIEGSKVEGATRQLQSAAAR
jgi:non-heme chloroperoxidase